LTITCGIDWAENHHDVALVDEAGKLVAKRRIGDGVQGYRQLLELFAGAGDSAGESIPVAVETARGLLISRLRATGRKVYSINPMAVARYREGHTVARAHLPGCPRRGSQVITGRHWNNVVRSLCD
jgi:transposase